jgi:hypothetical protein
MNFLLPIYHISWMKLQKEGVQKMKIASIKERWNIRKAERHTGWSMTGNIIWR